MRSFLLLSFFGLCFAAYRNEVVRLPGAGDLNSYSLPLPHEYTTADDLPANWNWANINGTSFVTKSLNQHLPQYCGSCWAHGAMSSFADRIKIARQAQGVDVNLSIQYILNCGTRIAGSCHGGDATATFEFVKKSGFVPYDTCLVYEACSSESKEGKCPSADYTCKPINTCRTCNTFAASGGKCVEIDVFPNATIAEYGEVRGVDNMKAEIYRRGPIACGVNAEPLLEYTGGVFDDKLKLKMINHIVSVIGWGVDEATQKEFWIVRNSWGEFWGEMGYFRIATGNNQLGLEHQCSWATPASWSEVNYPCYEDGSNCVSTKSYVDPSIRMANAAKKVVQSLQPQM